MMEIFNRIAYLFFSWRLWRLLLYPPENPIFWRKVKKHFKHKQIVIQTGLMILVAGMLSYAVWAYLTQFRFLFPIVLLTISVIFSSTITIFWMVNIISEISYEYHQATHDLICVTPLGIIGANWSIATGIVHRHDLFNWVDFGRRLFSGLILFILLTVFLALILTSLQNAWSHYLSLSLLLFEIGVLAIYSYIEFVHSVLLGVLTALLIPQYIHQISDANVWAIFFFIGLQTTALMIFIFGNLIAQSYFVFNEWQLRSILPQLLFLYVTRESFIYIFWKLLSYKANADWCFTKIT